MKTADRARADASKGAADATASRVETPADVQAAAEQWFAHQVKALRKSLGASWPEHREWVIEYLREEARLRLIARGWRPRRG